MIGHEGVIYRKQVMGAGDESGDGTGDGNA